MSVPELLELTRNYFRERKIAAPEQWIRAVAEKAEGEAVYLELVFRARDKNVISYDMIPDLPRGFVRLAEALFERSLSLGKLLNVNDVFPLLNLLLTSVEPISRGALKYCLNYRFDSGLNSILRFLDLFFVQTGLNDSDTVYPFAPQVREAFLSPFFLEKYPVSQVQALECFASGGLRLWRRGRLRWTTLSSSEPDMAERYFLERLPIHLLAVRETEQAIRVLTDFAYLMKRVRFLSVELLIAEYRQLPSELLAGEERLRVFADFFCRRAPCFEQETSRVGAERLLLQFACEEYPGSPVAQAARAWLNPPFGPSPCDWFWFGASDPETGEPLNTPLLNYGNRLGLNLEEAAKIQREKFTQNFDYELQPVVHPERRPGFRFGFWGRFLTWRFWRALFLLICLFLFVWKFCKGLAVD